MNIKTNIENHGYNYSSSFSSENDSNIEQMI